MNITVYLGANKGIDNTFTTAVRELGEWIGTNGHTLVYGGSKRSEERRVGKECRSRWSPYH